MTEIILDDPTASPVSLAALQAELQERGFHYLLTLRQVYFLNRAYQEMCEEEDWPFLEMTVTGTLPLEIEDLRTVGSVIDSTQLVKLRPMDVRNITDVDSTFITTGVPSWYYITEGTMVNAYPANVTDDFSVTYWRVPDQLVDDDSEPLIPTRFHQSIIDGACAYAYFDSDNIEMAQQMLQLWEMGKERMRQSLLVQQHDEPDDYIVTHNMDAP